jgi:hypothetical protein
MTIGNAADAFDWATKIQASPGGGERGLNAARLVALALANLAPAAHLVARSRGDFFA